MTHTRTVSDVRDMRQRFSAPLHQNDDPAAGPYVMFNGDILGRLPRNGRRIFFSADG